jgi:hypothetical protein
MHSWVFVLLLSSSFLYGEGIVETLLKERSLVIRSSVYGWCSEEKLLNFVDLVLEVKPDVCVEIGVSGGASLFPVALALKSLGKGVVFAIDPWDNHESSLCYHPVFEQADYLFWSRIDFQSMYRAYFDVLRAQKLGSHVVTLISTSEKAASLIPAIDILHIDGGHSEAVAAKDVELYLPKVRSGGYIWMNDVIWEQMQLAVDMLEEACDFVKSIDDGNCVLFRKR